MLRLAFLLLVLLGMTPALAGTVVSDAASHVSVTVYRDPARGGREMDLKWPGGYALITEKRRIHIPAGESVIRFEGVAEGMMPETAIVSGLPEGVREKNRDARLISPAGLVDAYLRRSVHLRRTSHTTGRVTEQDAVIRAGPSGGVVIETAEGFEALACSGLPERMLYDGVPEGLSAKPTLSVVTTSASTVDVTVELSYLAQGFDWSADYIANMDEGGRTASLFAWLTVANGGTQSFPDAQLQVVAGKPNKEEAADPPTESMGGLALKCWPSDITSTYPKWTLAQIAARPNALQQLCTYECDSIVVTGTRIRRESNSMNSPIVTVGADLLAQREDLGDLKLYRVPTPVTVAAHGQKQVAMINQPVVKFERFYAAGIRAGDYRIEADDYGEEREEREAPHPMWIALRTKNTVENGLGLPLPGGALSLFEPVEGDMLLAASVRLPERAVGQRMDMAASQSPDVQWTLKRVREDKDHQYWRIEISNAKPMPIRARISLPARPDDKPKGLVLDEGAWFLEAWVPANGRKTLSYRANRWADPEDLYDNEE